VTKTKKIDISHYEKKFSEGDDREKTNRILKKNIINPIPITSFDIIFSKTLYFMPLKKKTENSFNCLNN